MTTLTTRCLLVETDEPSLPIRASYSYLNYTREERAAHAAHKLQLNLPSQFTQHKTHFFVFSFLTLLFLLFHDQCVKHLRSTRKQIPHLLLSPRLKTLSTDKYSTACFCFPFLLLDFFDLKLCWFWWG